MTALDRITLRGLRVFARHGVHDAERREGQEFQIDAVLWLDTRPAAAGDDLSKTLAQRLVAACLAEPAVVEAEITVHKPHAPIAHPFDDVAVTIRRARA